METNVKKVDSSQDVCECGHKNHNYRLGFCYELDCSCKKFKRKEVGEDVCKHCGFSADDFYSCIKCKGKKIR